MHKECYRCKQSKILNEFDNDKTRKDGKFSYCKDCRRDYDGRKKLTHKVIGYLDGHMVTDNRYPEILIPGNRQRVHIYVAEKKYGRKIRKDECVHHIDGNKMNWSEDNIIIMDDIKHRKLEAQMKKFKNNSYFIPKICRCCGKKKMVSKNYLKVENKFKYYECQDCYYKNGGPGGRTKLLDKLENNE